MRNDKFRRLKCTSVQRSCSSIYVDHPRMSGDVFLFADAYPAPGATTQRQRQRLQTRHSKRNSECFSSRPLCKECTSGGSQSEAKNPESAYKTHSKHTFYRHLAPVWNAGYCYYYFWKYSDPLHHKSTAYVMRTAPTTVFLQRSGLPSARSHAGASRKNYQFNADAVAGPHVTAWLCVR